MSSASGFSEQKQRKLHCCISHEFLNTATQNLGKIAVIHAQSPPPPPPPPPIRNTDHEQSSAQSISSSSNIDSSIRLVYEGDQCFTYGEVLNAFHSLTSRLRSILDGGDDSRIFASQSSYSGESSGCTPASFVPSVDTFGKSKSGYRPKIVGIFMPPSVEYIVSVLAVLRCGEAFLPLDPSWPRERVLSIISSCNADVVITSASRFGRGGGDERDGLDWLVSGSGCRILGFSMEESVVECSDYSSDFTWPCEKEEGRLFCYLMYTSGSTGKPKGVCGTEQGLLNRFFWMQELYPLHGVEVFLFKTAVSFIDHLQEFLGAILTARVLVIPPFNELKNYPLFLVNYLQAYSINRLVAVPSLMRTILPALHCQNNIQIRYSLKLLVVSGEVFPLSLWKALLDVLPSTSFLNLYGSTEVAGDCTYFDCKRLPAILETEALTSVPIGIPITNCNVKLMGESGSSNEGEICVGGLCVSSGYFPESTGMSFDNSKIHDDHKCSENDGGNLVYFKTGDFARQLQSGDLVFVGRRDRTIKVNGQRIALDEIEITLREHPDIIDAAVILRECQKDLFLEAFLLLEAKNKFGDFASSSIRSWMVDKVPLAMIPNCFQLIDTLPMSSSGKVDYASLASSAFSSTHTQDEDGNTNTDGLLQDIKKLYCNALLIEEVSGDSDFFVMGGNSITAAHVSYSLGIDIRLLYKYPTPSKLHLALLEINKSCNTNGSRNGVSWKLNLKDDTAIVYNSFSSAAPNDPRCKSHEHESSHQDNEDYTVSSKRFRVNLGKHILSEFLSPSSECFWDTSMSMSYSLSRCNKIMYKRGDELRNPCQVVSSIEIPRNRTGYPMEELWRVHLESCVDASPLVVFIDEDVYVFIGSHAHKFVSIDAKSGSILWEVKLDGRIECSAAIVCDFSLVVVGSYMGKIYFLDFFSGKVCWTYQTFGEVKCQPAVDTCRELIWCGSHDHNLYGLDYKRRSCIFRLPCGGSIYGSPAIDEEHDTLYVASTSGRVTAISLSASPFHCLWKYELEVPVFASLSICSPSGNVVCCLVDGNIVAFSLDGSIIWRSKTGGPVFAGPCISRTLPSQVLICSRNGTVYSFEMEKGDLLWAYNLGDPITASAYVDEHLKLVSDPSNMSDRLVSVCTSSGSIYMLRINLDVVGKENQPCENMVQEFTRLDLPGDIFSSPVMVGGRIFVGCRDDYVHCVTLGIKGSTEE